MTLQAVKQAYKTWEAYETKADKDLKEGLKAVFENPTEDADQFFADIIYNFTDETDVFWVRQALKYSQRASNKITTIAYLEHMLSHYEKFQAVDILFSMAAGYLGKLASYPNTVLANLIEKDNYEEIDSVILKSIQSASYGAYIMTATNFQTGFDAGLEMESSNKAPTVKMAEEFLIHHKANLRK